MPRSSVLHRNDEYTGIRVSKTANPALVTIHDQHREGEFHRSPDLLGFAASSSLRPPHIDDEEVRQKPRNARTEDIELMVLPMVLLFLDGVYGVPRRQLWLAD